MKRATTASYSAIPFLQEEIEKLALRNRRLSEISQRETTSSPSVSRLRGLLGTLRLTLLFGSHVRLGSCPREHKWKAFVELDAGEDHELATQCIRDVSFECPQAGLFLTRITNPPYVMDRWCLGITPETVITCVVNYEVSVCQPRFTLLSHGVSPGAPQQKEVLLQLAPPGSPPLVGPRQARSAPTRRLSDEVLPGLWTASPAAGLWPRHRQSDSAGSWSSVLGSSAGRSSRRLFSRGSADLSSEDDSELMDRLASELGGRRARRQKHRLAFSLHSSSSESLSDHATGESKPTDGGGDSCPRHRRNSTPARRRDPRKYRHSISDSGFASDTSRRVLRVEKCHLKLKSTAGDASMVNRSSGAGTELDFGDLGSGLNRLSLTLGTDTLGLRPRRRLSGLLDRVAGDLKWQRVGYDGTM